MRDLERAAGAGGDVVKTVFEHSRLGRNQFLVAVLAPTLALASVTVGIFATRDSEAKARARQAEIQRSELVLPVYQEVVRTSERLDAVIDTCDDVLLELDASSVDDNEFDLQWSERCEEPVTKAFADLDEAVEVALLVSNDDLKAVADDLKAVQEDFENVVEVYNDFDLQVELGIDADTAEQSYDDVKVVLDGIREELIDAARKQILIDA